MSIFGNTLKFAAHTIWVFASSFIGFTLFGLLCNIGLFFYLPSRCPISEGVQGIAPNCTAGVLMALLFLAIFPILYGILGYRFAIQRSIHFGYVQNREFLFRYVIDKFIGFIQKNTSDSAANISHLAINFFDRLDHLPFVWRGIMSVVKKFIPMADLLDNINKEQIINATNRDAVAAQISVEADKYLQNDLLNPDKTLPTVLIIVNLLAFVLYKWII